MKLLPKAILFCALTTLLTAAETPKVGAVDPAVEALDHDGKAWKLADQAGKSAVILYFYPKDDTPGCTKEACGLRDRIEGLNSLGVSVVGVSRDDAESHRKFREKHGLNFPLLVDVDGKVTEAFGASAPDRPRSRRVSYLIGKDGKIVHVTDNRDAQVYLDELKTAVEALKQ
jgi:thioredoxin-dependent peroxiredoxin